MDRYDAWKSNPLLPQIRRAAGLDPDGPLVPMQAPQPREQAAPPARKAAKAALRDGMLGRAIGRLR